MCKFIYLTQPVRYYAHLLYTTWLRNQAKQFSGLKVCRLTLKINELLVLLLHLAGELWYRELSKACSDFLAHKTVSDACSTGMFIRLLTASYVRINEGMIKYLLINQTGAQKWELGTLPEFSNVTFLNVTCYALNKVDH